MGEEHVKGHGRMNAVEMQQQQQQQHRSREGGKERGRNSGQKNLARTVTEKRVKDTLEATLGRSCYDTSRTVSPARTRPASQTRNPTYNKHDRKNTQVGHVGRVRIYRATES